MNRIDNVKSEIEQCKKEWHDPYKHAELISEAFILGVIILMLLLSVFVMDVQGKSGDRECHSLACTHGKFIEEPAVPVPPIVTRVIFVEELPTPIVIKGKNQ